DVGSDVCSCDLSEGGFDRDSGASRPGASTHGAGEHSTRTGQELWRAVARLQCTQHESGESGRAESAAAGCTRAVAGGHRGVEREDLRDQPTNRASGTGKLPTGGAAEAGQRRGHADRADLLADPGRPAPLCQKSRRRLLSGVATGTQELGPERAANAHQQGGRSVSANVAGARSAPYLGTIRCGLRSEALGIEAGRARWKERQEESDRGHGAKAGSIAASPLGQWRSVRTSAQQPAERYGDRGIKTKPF